ncbi:MAG: ABC transporter permease [Bryobacteraceae bacterium]
MRRWEYYFWPVFTGVVCLLAWHWSVVWSKTTIFPSPLLVWNGVDELVRKGLLWGYSRDSLYRVGVGYAVAVVFGIPTGLTIGWYRNAAIAANPVIQVMRPISPLAWIPLSIVWFGVTDFAAIFLIFLASFFPIVVSTSNGVKNVPEMFLRAGRNFGLSPSALFRRVLFPAALPQILVGLRITFGIAWLVVVAAEMIAVDSGLGYLIIDARNAGKRYDLVVAGMLLIGVIGLALDAAARRVETIRSVRWGFRNE